MHDKEYGLALALNWWVEGHVGKGFVTQRRAKSLSDCSLAHTDKQFAFCEPFQKNLLEYVNCTCSVKVSVEHYNVTLMASRFVNNYRGKTGI
jgi:hypothetical protein